MIRLEWDDQTFSVGHPDLDSQHKKLRDVIIDFATHLNIDYCESQVHARLLGFIELSKEHMMCEEQLMKTHDYPDSEAHHKIHKAHFIKLLSLVSDDEKYEQKDVEHIIDYLAQWWLSHIQNEDMKYKPFLKKKD
ncbi:putative Hemerythrin family protein [Candidatus Terasakiella magnetica]|uniref:Putative Hemerythrin family protein n=1 Tax=Candidatus Terasakiella magnetica TaxID=1867952 RepID=A0A1C3RCH5_9PROT|nr:hemerythrin domain-containing protein [Candidatus Terasakiella magnetica]SCA54971.1 putative Hemerythrin family protein [Candidatus Terasakiella magnetica]